MKRSQIPLVMMLIGGGVTSIVTYVMHYELKASLWILLGVMTVFCILGFRIKKIMEQFEIDNTPEIPEEGEVVEKEMQEQEQDAEDATDGDE